MSTVQMLEMIEEIVASAMQDARESAIGTAPEPDSQVIALRIFHTLAQALRTDATFRDEVRRAMQLVAA
jgi:hypothetical protein